MLLKIYGLQFGRRKKRKKIGKKWYKVIKENREFFFLVEKSKKAK